MWGRLVALVIGILLGCVCMYVVLAWQMVVTEDNRYLVRKIELQLQNTYVDVSGWTMRDWAENPQVAQALQAAGYGEAVNKSLQDGLLEQLIRQVGQEEPPELPLVK